MFNEHSLCAHLVESVMSDVVESIEALSRTPPEKCTDPIFAKSAEFVQSLSESQIEGLRTLLRMKEVDTVSKVFYEMSDTDLSTMPQYGLSGLQDTFLELAEAVLNPAENANRQG